MNLWTILTSLLTILPKKKSNHSLFMFWTDRNPKKKKKMTNGVANCFENDGKHFQTLPLPISQTLKISQKVKRVEQAASIPQHFKL